VSWDIAQKRSQAFGRFCLVLVGEVGQGMQRRALWLVAGLVGGAVAALGSGLGLLVLASSLLGPIGVGTGNGLTVTQTLAAAGLTALALGLGIPLAIHGRAGWLGSPSRSFAPLRPWWLWIVLALLIASGGVANSLPTAPTLLLALIHVPAMALPPTIVLLVVGRALQGTAGSWREVIAGMAGGGFLGTGLSLIGEGLVLLALVVAWTVVTLLTPGGSERITALSESLQDPAWLEDPTHLLRLLRSPSIALSVVGTFAIPVPVIEEAFKTLAIGVVGRWVRPQPARAFLWGVAGGAGFALAENLLNGALGGAEPWAFGTLARLGATVMHCAAGGLVGWGWGQLWTARRAGRLFGAYAAAVAIHGLWNAAATGTMILSAFALEHEGNALLSSLIEIGMLALVAWLGLLGVTFLVALILAGKRLASEAERLARQPALSEESDFSISAETGAPEPPR
jgi:hypothetical protein